MTNECGSCALCCKFLNVPGLSGQGEWCQYAKPGRPGGGCTIHNHRPEACLGFDCFWKAENWPEDLRPDRCKVMFEALPNVLTVLATVEPSRPEAWKKQIVSETVRKLAMKGRPVVIHVQGKPPIYVLPEGITTSDIQEDIQVVLKGIENGGSELHA